MQVMRIESLCLQVGGLFVPRLPSSTTFWAQIKRLSSQLTKRHNTLLAVTTSDGFVRLLSWPVTATISGSIY